MKHQLFRVVVLLLFVSNAVGSLALGEEEQQQYCSYDEAAKRNGPPVAVVRELPKRGEDAWETYTASPSGEWAPLRIKVSAVDLQKKNKYCTKSGDVRLDYLEGERLTCTYSDVMTPARKEVLLKRILPASVKLHADRLLVRRASTSFIVPRFANNTLCSRFAVPRAHRKSPGVKNADFVLYVASGPKKSESSATWAVTCAVDSDKRPVVGAMHFYPGILYFRRGAVRLFAHELAHALGFNYDNLRKREMTKVMTIRGGERTVVTSSKTVEKAKEHYNCESLEGMELEDIAGVDENSHWEWRTARDELMSTFSVDNGVLDIGYYTALTIAAFEDMGYYKGKFDMAEPMTWGHKAGCEFLTEESAEKLGKMYPNMFCKEYDVAVTDTCASNRLGLGYCAESPLLGGNLSILYPYSSEVCEAKKSWDKYFGLTGPDARCLDGASLVKLTSKKEEVTIDGFCARVKCDGGVVSVQTNNKGEWHTCTKEGEIITPKATREFAYVSGGIKCPKYSEVCTVGADGGSLVGVSSEAAEEKPDDESP